MKSFKMLSCYVLILCFGVSLVFSGPAFTYQGRLQDGGSPADGLYDLQFRLFDDPNVPTGVQVGSTVAADDMDVTDGYFTVYLDFGDGVFDGSGRWLQAAVRPYDSNNPNDYVPLYPRLELTPTPYAMSVAAPLELSAATDYPEAVIKGIETSGEGTGVWGESTDGYGVFGRHSSSGNWGSLGGGRTVSKVCVGPVHPMALVCWGRRLVRICSVCTELVM